MKKIIPVLIFLLAALPSLAQNFEPLRVYKKEIIKQPIERSFSIENWIRNTAEFTSGDSLVLLQKKNSKTQTHYTYQKYYNGIAIHMGIIKVSVSHKGKITQYHNNTLQSSYSHYRSSKSCPRIPDQALNEENVWIVKNNDYYLGKRYQTLDQGLVYQTAILDSGYSFTELLTPEFSHTNTDTQGLGYIFLPNPITSANTNYGGEFIDNNDATSQGLDNERVQKNLLLTFQNNQFELENEYVKMVDIEAPYDPVAISSNGEFLFNRSETGFEDVNAFYHITTQKEYLNNLGFTDIVDYQIQVDARAHNGADQSSFHPANPSYILFGTGGVDDAEDADVIIHEYGHAIEQSASPNSNGGSERAAIGEALGDYFAASYSKEITYYKHDKIFSWDGHNEFWNGRELFNNRMYPQDLQFNLYQDAPLFSGSLMWLEYYTSREIAHTILIESLHSMYSFITMPEMAQLMFDADSLLYAGQYQNQICYAFLDRGIVDNCLGQRPMSLKQVVKSKYSTVFNSKLFAHGISPLTLKVPDEATLSVYTLQGKLISNTKFKNELIISPENYKKGTYLLVVNINNHLESHLIQRH